MPLVIQGSQADFLQGSDNSKVPRAACLWNREYRCRWNSNEAATVMQAKDGEIGLDSVMKAMRIDGFWTYLKGWVRFFFWQFWSKSWRRMKRVFWFFFSVLAMAISQIWIVRNYLGRMEEGWLTDLKILYWIQDYYLPRRFKTIVSVLPVCDYVK